MVVVAARWSTSTATAIQTREEPRPVGAVSGVIAAVADQSHADGAAVGSPHAEVAGAADASPLVSVVGAAWLLMGQPTVAATRALEASSQARTEGASTTTGPDPDRVSIIELRRPMSPPREQDGSSSERQYHHRWWVGGHWRQQACGKGPEGTPLMKDRVHVWRR